MNALLAGAVADGHAVGRLRTGEAYRGAKTNMPMPAVNKRIPVRVVQRSHVVVRFGVRPSMPYWKRTHAQHRSLVKVFMMPRPTSRTARIRITADMPCLLCRRTLAAQICAAHVTGLLQ